MSSALTKGEIATLRVILRHGGKVFVTMGRMTTSSAVRTSLMNRLADRGMIRTWVARPVCFLNGLPFTSGETVDVAVTADGCRALAATEAAS